MPQTRLDILAFFLLYIYLHILVLCNYVHVCVESQVYAGMYVCGCAGTSHSTNVKVKDSLSVLSFHHMSPGD